MLTILELIGNTPIVEVKRLGAGPCRLFLKLENQNPGGSIKDRIALSMIAAAESEGRIKPGDLLVEATAGNTGLGLAMVAGVGPGGLITGLARFFERAAPQADIVLADPEGSVLADYVRTGTLSREVGSWLVEGIGEDFIPPVCDLSRVKKAYSIPDAE